MQTLSTFARLLPLCCGLFLMAAEDDCTIRVVVDDDDDDCEDLEDVEEVCPLDCELALNDDDCPVCECAGGEGEGEGECRTDADCPIGTACVVQEMCTGACADGDASCEVACVVSGRCLEVNSDPCLAILCAPDTICVSDGQGNAQCIPMTGECRSDADCGPNAVCDFSQCGVRPDGSNEPGFAPCDLGFCVEASPPPPPFGCEAVLCEQGTHCVEGINGPVCVADGGECRVNEDCGPGAHCETVCSPDPNCPECDVCIFTGICVADACPALCGPGSECVIRADGTAGCEPLPTPEPECMSDVDCPQGTVCNASDACLSDPACSIDANGVVVCPEVCWGFCVAPPDQEPTRCTDDSQCGADQLCELRESCPACGDPNTDPACLAPCSVEGICVPF